MDCEKFESAMMDELYGELDEVTSAAAKRHVASCARCAVLLGGLRATRRVSALPIVEPPANLEKRILAAAVEAQKVVPLRVRVARAVSLAGSWAMRPQTAMAAVSLVAIGMSALLLRGKSSRAPASAEVTVTEVGTPAPAASVAALPSPEPIGLVPAPASWGSPSRFAEKATTGSPAGPAATAAADTPVDDTRGRSAKSGIAKAEDGVYARSAPARGGGGVSSFGGPAAAGVAAPGQAFATPPPESEQASTAPFDPSAELWAARAARDAASRQGKACPSVARFDDVASRASGTQPGWDALLEGAQCYQSIGDFSAARARLNALLGIDSYKDRARSQLAVLDQMQGQGAAAAPASRAAPKSRPAAPPAQNSDGN
jgi:hypothetical protein